MPLTHLGTDTSPRSDFSGLQRMVMTELRPWSHDAVTCRDLRGKKELFLLHWELKFGLFLKKKQKKTLPVVEVDVWNSFWIVRKQIWFGVDAVQDGFDCRPWKP